ncbi:unnamed protein product [Clonostachys rosea]|uniref:DNA-binding protein RAP1 n=1 Tax=Bionectria ochroleuca TaxID=29856 RepID=A0ABY6UVW3_BIOOC|nr:unnamed protein product [Clonostachys rosea]
MASGITYDGVPSDEGGKLFKDVNFWIAQRVPMRPRWVELIKSNGGAVVPLERQADIQIADDARKDAPKGSYSWKFIQDSVEAGMAQIKDKYLIGPDPDLPRPAASGSLARGKRVPFTPADDAVLVKWVLAQAYRGESKVKLFQEFEQINSRHTWQSWLDRWNKKLALLPSEQLNAIAASAPADTAVTSHSPAHSPPPPPSAQAPRSKVSPKSSPKPAPKPALKSSSKKQNTMARSKDIPDTIPETPQREPASDSLDAVSDASSPIAGSEELEKERAFLLDLQTYASVNGLPINISPTIKGQPLSLYKMVTLLDGATEDIDWEALARDLGFDASRKIIVRAVQQIWNDNLKDFLDDVESFDEEEEEELESDLDPDQDDELGSDPRSEDLATPRASKKRPLGGREDDTSSPRPPKRNRIDPYDDIPSSPPSEQLPTRKQPALGSPILGSYTPERQVSSGRRTSKTTRKIPTTPITKTPQLPTHESSYDVTPSQQLDLEAQHTESPVKVIRRPQQTHTSPAGEGSPRPRHPSHPATAPPAPRPNSNPPPTTPKPLPKPAKRRTLPASFARSDNPPKSPAPPRRSTPPRRPHSLPMTDNNDRNDTGNVTPRATNSHISEPTTIEGWVEHYQSLGYSHAIVVAAMTATTMTPGCLTAHALESLSAGNGIPKNTEGIWTDRDDKALRSLMSLGERIEDEPTDAGEHQVLQKALRERRRLLHKHGQRRMVERERLLKASDGLPSNSGRERH